MSDTNGSTVNAEEVLREFDLNPVGATVRLRDGSEACVTGYRVTPRGRWLRLRRRGGQWVREVDVVGVVVYTVSLVKGSPAAALVSA